MVEWIDIASTYDPAWTAREEITDLECVPCLTVGIVLNETVKEIRVVLSINASSFSQAIVIPKSCIKRMRTLKIKEG